MNAFEKNFSFLCAAAAAVLISGCVSALAPSDSALALISPENGATVPTLSEGQKAYLVKPRAERVKLFASEDYRKEMKSLGYYPLPTRLVWTYDGGAEARLVKGDTPIGSVDHIAKYNVEVARLPDMKVVFTTNFVSFVVTNSVEIDNLEIARDYKWTVRAGDSTAFGTFKTEDIAPRLIRLPGVPNVRDLGGRIGLDGRRVKQNMVFRTAGLNDNASTTYYTREELIAKDPSLAGKVAVVQKDIEKWKAIEANPGQLKIVDAVPGEKWTVFIPDNAKFKAEGEAALAGLTAIPAEFLGAKASEITLASGQTHFFDKKDDSTPAPNPAVLMQEVEASDDGWMAFSAGGDYWWNLRSNGEMAFDLMKAGNWRGPYNSKNYAFPVPVKKGRNLIVVTLRSGAATWSWGCESARNLPAARLAHDKVRSYEKLADSLFGKVEKGKSKGKYRLDAKGLDYALNVMGIKSDIDLRSDSECWGMTGSPLGDTVTWYHYSSGAYGGMQSDFGRNAFTEVFKVFLDEKNYPIDFHCIAGQDRTGAVAFIINGLLGVDEEDLYRDWESTGFWNGNAMFNHARLFNNLVAGFQKWPGDTINQKIEAYVLDLGFTKKDIAHLRDIMLEK